MTHTPACTCRILTGSFVNSAGSTATSYIERCPLHDAARDLYAALTALLWHDFSDHGCSCHADDLANAALAQARGES